MLSLVISSNISLMGLAACPQHVQFYTYKCAMDFLFLLLKWAIRLIRGLYEELDILCFSETIFFTGIK